MIKNIQYFAFLAIYVILCSLHTVGHAQENEVKLKGKVLESGTNEPLKQAIVSVISSGTIAETNEHGEFEINVPDLQTEILVNLPGYDLRRIFLKGSDDITIHMVQEQYVSIDDEVYTPLGIISRKDAAMPITTIDIPAIQKTPAASLDNAFQGRVAGLNVVRHSGMPGQKAWLDIGGATSIFCKNEPMIIIDGMIHEINYADYSIIDGFSLNPMDIIDVQDVSNISVIKGTLPYFGSLGSNGAIYINSEQKSETSAAIQFSSYGGIGLVPSKLDVLGTGAFRSLFREQLSSAGYNNNEIQSQFPWLDGGSDAEDYYKYSNNTDWQGEIFKPSAYQKYHIFLKGGDDIATYNISTGYLRHGGIYEESAYSRYNLRINGKINISDRFAVLPNVKLSLADSYLANMGPEEASNPLLAALLKSPLMQPIARDPATGTDLTELDDVGVFNVSNPVAIIQEGSGNNRNYHFLSSVDAQYRVSDKIMISTLTGLDFNNSRESLFLPDHGLVQVGFAENSRHDLVYEFRSTQNHTKISYNDYNSLGNRINVVLGLRYMQNSYKYDEGNDLNTPSDDFRNLGQGAKFQYLRTTLGDNRELIWMSYYGVFRYSIRDKYYLNGNLSLDGNSNVTSNTRYNLYPSVNLAWRLTSEDRFSSLQRLADMKLRLSYGLSGNLYSSVYDYSKLFYIGRRWNQFGVLVRDAIPNPDLEIEKKSTINAGVDMAINQQTVNIHLDYYYSRVGNLIINQQLPDEFGFTDYYDNGGVLASNAVELSFDSRIMKPRYTFSFGASASLYSNKVQQLDFIDENKKAMIYDVIGAQYITEEGESLNMFYGFETNGTFSSGTEAGNIKGPNGINMREGDVKFVDQNSDNVIDDKDKTIIGNPNPDLFGGFFASLSLKNIEISTLFNYSVGNDIYNYVKYKAESMDQFYNQFPTVNDRYNSSNTNTDVPRAVYGDPRGNSSFSDRWIEDGSYLKLKEITISYIPPKFSNLYRDLTVFLTATNVLTFTKYTGYDPEFFYQNNLFNMGLDYGKIPHVRSIIVGVKLAL